MSAQELLGSHIPARLAYTALDGTPRAVSIAFHFTDERFVMATVENAPKVMALRANPDVALTIDTETQPPHALLVRGTASLTTVEGVPQEYLDANRKMIPADQWDGHGPHRDHADLGEGVGLTARDSARRFR